MYNNSGFGALYYKGVWNYENDMSSVKILESVLKNFHVAAVAIKKDVFSKSGVLLLFVIFVIFFQSCARLQTIV